MTNNNFVVLGLGSNLGDRKLALDKALKMLNMIGKKSSEIYETQALLKPNSPKSWDMSFLNMITTGYTEQNPNDLLLHIKEVERSLGRKISQRWSPRIIDIDILFYNNDIINMPQLRIPHPELHKRQFVLEPLSSIMQDYIHPIYKKSIKTLLEELSTQTT